MKNNLTSKVSAGPLKFAVIGCGFIGKRHAAIIQNMGHLVAVCDNKLSNANQFRTLYGCNAYNDFKSMFSAEGIDVAVICSPNYLHAEFSIYAMKAGCHVICEKPMALSVEDCMEMINVSKSSQKNLFIVKQNRYNALIQSIRKMLISGELGKLLSLQVNCFWNRNDDYYKSDWKGTGMDGGILFTQFSHFIDLMYWLAGDVDLIYSLSGNNNHPQLKNFDDQGVVILRFKNECLGSLHFTINSYKKNMEGSITLFAEKGSFKIGGEYLDTLEYQVADNSLPHFQFNKSADCTHNNYLRMYEDIISLVNRNILTTYNVYDSMKTIEIIEKIIDSANANQLKTSSFSKSFIG